MAFTAKDVAELRRITGAGMMDCKKALTAVDGDMEKAGEYLREQGVNIAAKKADRVATEGAVVACVSKDFKQGSLVEVNCQTDFVGKSEPFIELCNQIAKQVLTTNPATVEEVLGQTFVDDKKQTVQDIINNATAKIGEKISVRRFVRHEIKKGHEEFYIHMGGKIGVLLEVETDKVLSKNEAFIDMCRGVCMHIAAIAPAYMYPSEVPSEEAEKEKEILTAQALNEGKPAAVVEKMVVGRIKKYYQEICLVEQEFVKSTNKETVAQYVEATGKQLGASIKLVKFSKFIMGEGLEKQSDNLAEEVAKITKQ